MQIQLIDENTEWQACEEKTYGHFEGVFAAVVIYLAKNECSFIFNVDANDIISIRMLSETKQKTSASFKCFLFFFSLLFCVEEEMISKSNKLLSFGFLLLLSKSSWDWLVYDFVSLILQCQQIKQISQRANRNDFACTIAMWQMRFVNGIDVWLN